MKKWLGRIGEGLDKALFAFVVVSILGKLIFKETDWLFRSLALSIPEFFAIPITYYALVDKKYKKWPVVIYTTLCVFIATLFILGVCLDVEEYWWKTFTITFFSAWAMAFARVDQERDNKRTEKKTKQKIDADIVV